MPMGMSEWDGTPESAREINCAFNAVLDVLVNAGMWTGDPPYRGKNAAEQVRMLVRRAEEAEAQLAAVPAYATYHFEAQLYHDLAEGPEPLNFAGWLAAGQPEGAHNG